MNVLASTTRTYAITILFIGSVIQLIGFTILTVSPGFGLQSAAQLILEAVVSLGIGLSFSVLVVATPYAVDAQELGMFSQTKSLERH